jgi:putative membrane protein
MNGRRGGPVATRRLAASTAACAAALAASCAAWAHGGPADGPSIDVAQLAALAALGLAGSIYVRALFRSTALKARHAVAFLAGWTALLLALAPPLDAAAVDSFALHMVQHELLMIIAPPLLILGRPYAALGASLPSSPRWTPLILRAAALPLATPPLAAFGLHLLALWVWHVPRLFDAGLESDGVHALQHACFFWTALLFWWAVLRQWRSGVALAWLLGATIASGALAALLTFAPAPLYAGASLADQQLGGLLMWVPAGYALLFAALLGFHRLLRTSAA